MVSEAILLFFQWMFYTVLTLGVDVFGTMSNIVNIVCLVKLGFKDIVNLSFLGNADLVILVA